MSSAKTPLSPAQDLAHQVLDVLQDKRLGHSMWKSGAPRPELDQLYWEMEGKLSFIGRTFNELKDQTPRFASEFAHTLKTEFAQKPHLRETWDDPRLQEMVGRTLGTSLQTYVHDTAHPIPKVAFASPPSATAPKVIKLPEVVHEQEFVANMGKAIAAHEEQLKLTQSSALGATPIHSVAQSVVDQHYQAAMDSYNTGLEQALDKQLFHDSAMIELEKAIKANPGHLAALKNPQLHEAVKQHLGDDIAAKLHAIAPAAEAPAYDIRHVQEFAAKLKTGLEAHEEQLKLAGASEGVMRGTEAVVAGHYKAAASSFAEGLSGAKDKQAFHDAAIAEAEKMIQAHPHAKATLLNPKVQTLVEQHLGDKLAASIQTVAHPEIAQEAAEALARTEGLAAVASAIKATATAKESAAINAGAELEKAASKMGGKAKWLVAGAGAAVALGALMHLDGKSHARTARNRANNPLNDAALAR